MGWLKKIFGQSKVTNISIEVNAPKEKLIAGDRRISTKHFTEFIGLDIAFIDLIYFSNEIEKNNHILAIQTAIIDLNIKEGDEGKNANKLICEYNYSDRVYIEYFPQSFLMRNYHLITSEKNGIKKEERVDQELIEGLNKLRNDFYLAFSFAISNIERKHISEFFDFEFERELIVSSIKPEFHYGHELKNALSSITDAYFSTNQIDKLNSLVNYLETLIVDFEDKPKKDFYKTLIHKYNTLNDIEKVNRFTKIIKNVKKNNPKPN